MHVWLGLSVMWIEHEHHAYLLRGLIAKPVELVVRVKLKQKDLSIPRFIDLVYLKKIRGRHGPCIADSKRRCGNCLKRSPDAVKIMLALTLSNTRYMQIGIGGRITDLTIRTLHPSARYLFDSSGVRCLSILWNPPSSVWSASEDQFISHISPSAIAHLLD